MNVEIIKKNSKAKKYLLFYFLIELILLCGLLYIGFLINDLKFATLIIICTLIPASIKLYYSYLDYPLYVEISDQNIIFKSKKKETKIDWDQISNIKKSISWGIDINLKNGNTIYHDMDKDIIEKILQIYDIKKIKK